MKVIVPYQCANTKFLPTCLLQNCGSADRLWQCFRLQPLSPAQLPRRPRQGIRHPYMFGKMKQGVQKVFNQYSEFVYACITMVYVSKKFLYPRKPFFLLSIPPSPPLATAQGYSTGHLQHTKGVGDSAAAYHGLLLLLWQSSSWGAGTRQHQSRGWFRAAFASAALSLLFCSDSQLTSEPGCADNF